MLFFHYVSDISCDGGNRVGTRLDLYEPETIRHIVSSCEDRKIGFPHQILYDSLQVCYTNINQRFLILLERRYERPSIHEHEHL
jgi:hypothetical protein